MDIRAEQKSAVEAILGGRADGSAFDWKVLVLDETCRDVVAPLLSVNELRKLGVTLHLLLESERDALQDAVAVYLCRPDAQNVARIAADGDLYGRIEVNFSSRVDRRTLESLARAVAARSSEDDEGSRISSIWDRHVEFVGLEARLFSLSRASDVEETATGLACACATLLGAEAGAVVIRSSLSETAVAVGQALTAKLKPSLVNKTGGKGLTIVVLDRRDDLLTPLRHAETYQGMIDDLLGLKANRVTVRDESFELNGEGDAFFNSYAQQPLPDVIDASSEHLAELNAREKRLRARTAGETATASSKELMEAVDELPKVLENKKRLSGHTKILEAIMGHIAQRQIPQFIEAEKGSLDKKLVAELLDAPFPDDKLPALYDRLRLLFVWALDPDDGYSDDELQTLLAGLNKAVSDDARATSLLEKSAKALAVVRGTPDGQAPQQTGGEELGLGARFLATAQAGATKLVDKAAKGVTSLLHVKSGYATRVLDDLFEARGPIHDSFRSFVDTPAVSAPPPDALVFFVGPGCYAEHHAIQAAFANSPRNIVYGATSILNGPAFLDYLTATSV